MGSLHGMKWIVAFVLHTETTRITTYSRDVEGAIGGLKDSTLEHREWAELSAS